MEIGLFQLENLLLTGSRFQFLFLEEEKPQLAPDIEKLMERAHFLNANQALEHLKESEKVFPVILVSTEKAKTLATASQLERAGFTNVYWIEL